MTIICAAVGLDGIWLGCDRQRTLADRERGFTPPKWVINPERTKAIAMSGAGIAGNLLRENARLLLDETSPRAFWLAFTAVLKANGCAPKTSADSAFLDYDFGALYAHHGLIFDISNTGEICRLEENWYARGSGDQYALGALFALSGTSATTEECVKAAVWAACRYDIRCGGEPWVEKL